MPGQARARRRRDEQRGGAEQDVAVGRVGVRWTPRKGRRWVGDGVDEAAHELAALGREAQVGAAEGDDAGVGVGAREDGEAVGPQAGAEDGAAGFELRRRRLAAGGSCAAVVATAVTAQPQRSSPPAARTSAASARQTAPKSTTAVPGACSAAMPAACGSTSRRPSASSAAHAGHAVGVRAALELVERGQLAGAQRDDELAEPAHGDRRAARSRRPSARRRRRTGAP